MMITTRFRHTFANDETPFTNHTDSGPEQRLGEDWVERAMTPHIVKHGHIVRALLDPTRRINGCQWLALDLLAERGIDRLSCTIRA
jgi:hypothetical protein